MSLTSSSTLRAGNTAAGGVQLVSSPGGGASSAEYTLKSAITGGVPADYKLVFAPFHTPYEFNEILIEGEPAPASDYDVIVDVDGTALVFTLPAGQNQFVADMNQSIPRLGVLEVFTQATRDSALENLAVSFDLDPAAAAPPSSSPTSNYVLSSQSTPYVLS